MRSTRSAPCSLAIPATVRVRARQTESSCIAGASLVPEQGAAQQRAPADGPGGEGVLSRLGTLRRSVLCVGLENAPQDFGGTRCRELQVVFELTPAVPDRNAVGVPFDEQGLDLPWILRGIALIVLGRGVILVEAPARP